MQLNGLLYGSRLLAHVDFPTSEVLGPDASEDAIQGLIDRHGLIFIKPVFRGGVGKKGKAGLIGKARTLKEALAEKERLYFCEHRHGNAYAKSNGVTFEAGVPAEHEVYFSITDNTTLPGADDDADPPRRHGHRGAAEVGRGDRAVRGADRAEGLRRGERADRHRRAEGDHLAAGAAPAEAVGAGAPLRHDHDGAEPDPDAARSQRAADAGGLRLQVRLRPRRSAGGAARAAGPAVRGRRLGLRAGGEPAAHPPGAVGRVRHQRAGHDPGADLRRRARTAS